MILHDLANKYKVGIAEIAARYILQKPHVGGIIIGVRNRKHLDKLLKISSFTLSNDDLLTIEGMTLRSKDLWVLSMN